MIKVLFVCLGNICRSPMAEAVFQHYVNQEGLNDKILVDSAGTGNWHEGEPAHHGTLAVLKRHGIHYQGHARQITHSDIERFDYLLAMDKHNLAGIQRYVRGDKPVVALFLSYAYQRGLVTVQEVPDPYYSGKFDDVYDLVDKGAQAFLAHIRQAHAL